MSINVSSRVTGTVALLVVASAVGFRFLDPVVPSIAALGLLTASAAVGVILGMLLALLWRPRPQLTALEAIGFGIATSLGLV